MASSDDDFVGAIVGIIASASIIVALLYSVVILVPVGILIFVGWLVYKYYFKSPAALEKKSREHTWLLYDEAKKKNAAPDAEEFGRLIFDRLQVPLPFLEPMIEVALELYDLEGFTGEIPEPPAKCDSIEGARYRDYLSSLSAKSNAGAVQQMADTLVECFGLFLRYVPPSTDESIYNATFSTFCTKPGDTVTDLVVHLFDENHFGLFKSVKETLIRNQHEVSGVPMVGGNPDKLINPSDYEGENLIFSYLKDTPFLGLFDVSVPVAIDEELRFSHTWVLAPPKTGKTQLIQYLVSHDLPKVARGEASVVVMDSQGDLINNISNLQIFAEGEPLDGKLIVIRPDLKYPPALNLFDMGRDRLDAYEEETREKMANIVIEQLTSVLDAMLGEQAQLTTKQETLYRYIIRLLMAIPGANLDTFTALLEATSLDDYQLYIDQLSKPAQDFFNKQFLGAAGKKNEFAETKKQVAWRISKLRENPYFDRMFSSHRSKLDLFTELNESKVILIYTDIEKLTEEVTNVFGRYFIGALLSASQERASLPHAKRIDTFCYIDECADYISQEPKIARLLDQARKMRVGMVLAHQRLKQIKNDNVKDALIGSTAIKFVNSNNPNDISQAYQTMRVSKEFIADQPKGSFALSVDGMETFSFRVPFGVVEDMEKMSKEQRNEVRDDMRARFSEKYTPDEPDTPDPEPTQPAPTESDPSESNIAGSKW